MNLHREFQFEGTICGYLVAHGWLYAVGGAGRYDRAPALCGFDSGKADMWGTPLVAKSEGAVAPRKEHRSALTAVAVIGKIDVQGLA